jgi:hypothetical protein
VSKPGAAYAERWNKNGEDFGKLFCLDGWRALLGPGLAVSKDLRLE